MKIKKVLLSMTMAAVAVIGFAVPSFADGSFSVSPMNQRIVLNPGETYYGSFRVTNPAKNEEDFDYKTTITPFYVTEKYEPIYDKNNGDVNQIVEWTTVQEEVGTVVPNSTEEIHFSIDVPEDAPAGGQYMSIKVTSRNDESNPQGVNIKTSYEIAHIVFAEIAGTTKRSGDIINISIPSFLFSGNIGGTASIRNTGNVHGTGIYTLQVFPLFSDEEVFTNEEEPDKRTILPDRVFENSVYWFETPNMGIYKALYTVEFEGVTQQLEKVVIVCPLWLLFIIVAAVLLILFRMFARKKKN